MLKLHEQLLHAGVKVAVAESCTGGLLGAALSHYPGSSAYFLGGVLVYSNELKRALLGVPPGVLERFGAVSAPCAKAMARGCLKATGADIALAVTGIAGPGGATPEKPVGLVFLGLARGDEVLTRRLLLRGDRERVRAQAVQKALEWLARELSGSEAPKGPRQELSGSEALKGPRRELSRAEAPEGPSRELE